MLESFFTALARASRHWKMVALLLVTNILFAVPLTLPIFLLLLQTTGGTRAAQRMFADKLDFIWLTDLVNEQFAGFSLATMSAQIALLLLALGAAYLLVSMLFAGGILNVLAAEDGRFTLRRFGEGCGAYFGRFFRLWCISLFFYAAAFAVYKLLMMAVNAADSRASAAQPGVIKRWLLLALLLLLLAVINMIFDYAKVGAVIGERRRMFAETARAVRFTRRRLVPALSLYLLVAVVGFLVFALLTWLRSLIPQASSITVLAAILLGQFALAARMWTRVAFYAAASDYYLRHAPKVVPPDVRPAEKPPVVEAAPPATAVPPLIPPAAPATTPGELVTSLQHDAPPVLYVLGSEPAPRADEPEEKTTEEPTPQ